MKKMLGVLMVLASFAGCDATGGDDAAATDTLTRAQKDSIVADLPIPGAGAVGRAMEARDRADARAADHDSIG